MNAKQNIIGIIAMATALGNVVEQQYVQAYGMPSKVPATPRKIIDTLKIRSALALAEWDKFYTVTENDYKVIAKTYEHVGVKLSEIREAADVLEMAGMLVELITALLTKIKHPVRRQKLIDIIDALKSFDRYYGRRLDADEQYAAGLQTAELFQEEFKS